VREDHAATAVALQADGVEGVAGVGVLAGGMVSERALGVWL
jgi:hypothetical protein